MGKAVVFVLGPDRPGIIAAVAATLYERGCNLEDVSQTTLQGEFVGIFIAALPGGESEDTLLAALRERLAGTGLLAHLRPLEAAPAGPAAPGAPAEPFVITTVGPDRPGLVAGIAGVLARFGVNITNLRALPRGEPGRPEYVTFYEVDIPAAVEHGALRCALGARARELGMEVNVQHRAIFEQIHRV